MKKRNKKQKFHGQQQRPAPTPAHVLPAVDVALLKASVVAPREWEFLQIILAGAGGTGS